MPADISSSYVGVGVDLNSEGEVTGRATERLYRFAIVPKQLSSPFFTAVHEGCKDQARKLGNVECVYRGTVLPDIEGQAEIIRSLVAEGNIDGIAVSIIRSDSPVTKEAIRFGGLVGIPVITFDSDDPGSEQLTYIGTDNYKYGQAFAKVLLQIDPTGGYYGLVSTQALNAIERADGLRDRLKGSNWIEHETSPSDCEESGITGIKKMREFASFPEMKAIMPMGGWPMRNASMWESFVDDFPHITTVGADALPHQMSLLHRGYVTGLVGQVPFQMGSQAMNVLLSHNRGEVIPSEIFGTSLHEIITMPLDLPPADVDMHYIGNLRYLGFAFTAIIVFMSAFFAGWTYLRQEHRIIRASQPPFLFMITAGVTIMGSSMIPLSFDDGNGFVEPEDTCVVACVSSIWLLSIGFTTVFSALFSKTWRINKIWHNPIGFNRVTVTARDVMGPFFALLLTNIITLSLMTALAPLEFVRQPHAGTDDWNRVISTYGTCKSTTAHWGGAIPYYVALLVINMSALIFANIQAYEARSIQSEFSESHYIAIAMASMLQTFLIAGPILFLVVDIPETSYILKVCMIFIICAIILLCVFIPKIVSLRKQEETSTRRRHLAGAAQESHRPMESHTPSSSYISDGTGHSPIETVGLRITYSHYSEFDPLTLEQRAGVQLSENESCCDQ